MHFGSKFGIFTLVMSEKELYFSVDELEWDDLPKQEDGPFSLWVKNHQRETLIIISVILLLGAYFISHYQKMLEASYEQTKQTLTIDYLRDEESGEYVSVFEYGDEPVKVEDLIVSHAGDMEIEGEKVISTSEVGNQSVTIHLSTLDSYNQEVVKTYVRLFHVVDTKMPVIELHEESLTIREGESFDPYENIAHVYDEVDGDYEKGESLTQEKYFVESSVDTSVPGTYEVLVKAMDNHDNISEKSYSVTVKETWKGPFLSRSAGAIYGPSGKETYYNLNMGTIISVMRSLGFSEADYPYWIREDGCKMLGPYIMVAANYSLHPKGSLVETSLGTGIVCDTGGFAKNNPTQIDIATNW